MKLIECRDCAEQKPVSRFTKYTSPNGERRCLVCAERAKDLAAENNRGEVRTTKKRHQAHPSKKHLGYVEFSIAAKATECEICGDVPESKNLCVDHCHNTGEIRGVLCDRCNLAIGCLSDDRIRLEAAMNYIEAYRHKLECGR